MLATLDLCDSVAEFRPGLVAFRTQLEAFGHCDSVAEFRVGLSASPSLFSLHLFTATL